MTCKGGLGTSTDNKIVITIIITGLLFAVIEGGGLTRGDVDSGMYKPVLLNFEHKLGDSVQRHGIWNVHIINSQGNGGTSNESIVRGGNSKGIRVT